MRACSDYTGAMPDQSQFSLIQRWARELGFHEVGVTDLDLGAYTLHLERYLERGYHGDMGYLARNQRKRLNPAELVPGTTRIISARMNYLPPGTEPLNVLANSEQAYVSRYALGRDYHKVIRKRLGQLASRINTNFGTQNGRTENPAAALRAFTDSAPVLEKALAEKAGLGWIGKHTLLLNKEVGSWFFLGEIFTNLPLPVTLPAETQPNQSDQCGNCKACITVCPTDAIVAPRQLDARRCISYLTIENKGPIPEEYRVAMGNRVFGCDDCQLFCPWNRQALESDESDFTPRNNLDQARLIDLFEWSPEEFDKNTRGSAIRRVSFDQWQRNLAVGLGNGPYSKVAISALTQRKAKVPEWVAEHFDWAIGQLESKQASRV